MCAYACDPGAGSEPGIGWHWAEQASKRHEVWVLANEIDRPALEREMAERPNPNLHFVFHGLPRWTGNPQRLPVYLAWHLTAIPLVRRLHREHRFDLAHHVTYGAFRYPTVLAWSGIPYVIGPISGAERPPLSFLPSFGFKGALTELIRLVTSSFVWAIPLTRTSLKRAKTILVVSRQTHDRLPTWAQPKAVQELACGISAEPEEHPDNFDVLRILSTGRLLYWKGIHYGLRAFAELRKQFPDARMSICGDGPEAPRLKKLCAELGITESVDFLHNYSHLDAVAQYKTHSIFLSPIVHLNGIAVLEAMSAGMPIVELDNGEEHPFVTPEAGIRVPMRNPDQVVRDLTAALTRLASDPALAKQMGLEGQRRVREELDWDYKAGVIDRVYTDVAGRAGQELETVRAPSP
jgi:glycosyltransferase involved in cell wall biosynthesis